MSKRPNVTTIQSGYYSTGQLNNNFTNIASQFDNTLSLDGSTPNAMNADLDMNGQDILNVNTLTVGGQDVFKLINQVTVSTAAPSGGKDGDIWFRVPS